MAVPNILIGIAALGVLFIAGDMLASALFPRRGARPALIAGLFGAPLAAVLGIPLALLSGKLGDPSFYVQSFVGAAPSWGVLFGFLVGFYRAFRRPR